MYAGRIVEQGSIEQLFAEPRHPYTRGLFDAIPRIDGGRERLIPIPGTVPNPKHLPTGCAFSPRCPRALDICRREQPRLDPLSDGRLLACHQPVPVNPWFDPDLSPEWEVVPFTQRPRQLKVA